MTMTATAKADMYSSPVRVRIDVTSTLLTQRLVTVTRIHANGDEWPVIFPPDQQLLGGAWAGFDYHAPSGQLVSYRVSAGTESATTAKIVQPGKTVKLQHPTIPSLSLAALFVPEGGLGDLENSTSAGIFDIIGSDLPVSVTDETIRRSSSIQLAFTPAQCVSGGPLDKLLRNGGPLLLNIPQKPGWDISWLWVQRQNSSIKNPGKRASGGNAAYPFRVFEMSYIIVNQPRVSQQTDWDFDALSRSYASFDAVTAAFADFQALTTKTLPG